MREIIEKIANREIDYWATITIDDTKVVYISGTMYNGTADLYFEK